MFLALSRNSYNQSNMEETYEAKGLAWTPPSANKELQDMYRDNPWFQLLSPRAQDCINLTDKLQPIDPNSSVEETLIVSLRCRFNDSNMVSMIRI